MSPAPLADLGLPPELADLLRSIFGDTEAARRAALAPWPSLGYRSLVQERRRFRPPSLPGKRALAAIEQQLTQQQASFHPDRLFFVAPGTSGTLRSPYPELSDAEYWLFVDLWDTEEATASELAKPHRDWQNLNTLEFLRRYRRPGPRGWLDRLLHVGGNPLDLAYGAHVADRAGIYS